MVDYSVIIPVYNSEATIEEVADRCIKFFRSRGERFELILVNDRSRDSVMIKLISLFEKHREIVVIDLQENAGQHAALLCGIIHSRGERIVTLDDDLQNPPEEVEKLIHKMNEGYELVMGRYMVKRHDAARRAGSRIISALNRILYNKPGMITLSNFRIFTRNVAGKLTNQSYGNVYLPGLLLQSAVKIANADVIHLPRKSGVSGYTFLNILKVIYRMMMMRLSKHDPGTDPYRIRRLLKHEL